MIDAAGQLPPATGLSLAPFRATRYGGHDLAAVTSPPYDVVEPDRFAHLAAADIHNVVRLILPRPAAASQRYQEAAELWSAWRSEGVLVTDERPALWVYQQSGPAGSLVGVIGAVPVDQPRAVLPHEDVMAGPVQDRAALMAAVGANLEPILLVYNSGPDLTAAGATTRLADSVRDTEPDIVVQTADDGSNHRLWAVTDTSVHQAVADDLARRSALIADGHHRFAAYRQLHQNGQPPQESSTPCPGADRGLALMVDGQAHPLRLGAIHRAIAVSIEMAMAHLPSQVTSIPFDGLQPAARWLDDATQRTKLVVTDGSRWAGLATDDAAAIVRRPDRSAQWRSLPTALLHEVLLPNYWNASEGAVTYHHDIPGALRAASGGIAVLLPALGLSTVMERAAAGELLPRKSTSFGPKPRTGLLMRTIEDSQG